MARFFYMQKVLHNGRNLFFSGWVVATYKSRTGVTRCVVENETGMTYITDEVNLEPLSFNDPLAPRPAPVMKVSKY